MGSFKNALLLSLVDIAKCMTKQKQMNTFTSTLLSGSILPHINNKVKHNFQGDTIFAAVCLGLDFLYG